MVDPKVAVEEHRVGDIRQGAQHRKGAHRGGTSVVRVGTTGEALRGRTSSAGMSTAGEPLGAEAQGRAKGQQGGSGKQGLEAAGEPVVAEPRWGELAPQAKPFLVEPRLGRVSTSRVPVVAEPWGTEGR